MVSKKKIAGVAILFNPDYETFRNIQSYLPYIDKLFVIDNSIIKNPLLIKDLQSIRKITYFDHNENKGIAFALNLAARLSLEENYEWLLTMDQDSKFEDGALELMIDYISHANIIIGIISPRHFTPNISKPTTDTSPREVLTVATSGNMLNLKAFEICGGFLEKLFIDSVDHEYCLRLDSYGFKVVLFPAANLIHYLGNSRTEQVMGIKVNTTHHNNVRRYYMTRNKLLTIKMYYRNYPKWCLREFFKIVRGFLKVIFVEDNKKEKVKSIISGIYDFAKGKYGKMKE